MSLFQYLAGVEGYRAANGAKSKSSGGEGMDDDRVRELGIEGF